MADSGPPADDQAARDPKLLDAIDAVAAEAIRRLFDETTDEPVRDLRDAIAEGLYDALLANPKVTALRPSAVAVPAETRDDERARNLEAAGIQLADAARSLAYTWETDSTDKRMWDAWKKVGPAIDAWMAALRAADSEGTS